MITRAREKCCAAISDGWSVRSGSKAASPAGSRALQSVSAVPQLPAMPGIDNHNAASVESKMGAVAWGQWPTPRFPSPLIEP